MERRKDLRHIVIAVVLHLIDIGQGCLQCMKNMGQQRGAHEVEKEIVVELEK